MQERKEKEQKDLQEILNYKLNLNMNPSILREWKERQQIKDRQSKQKELKESKELKEQKEEEEKPKYLEEVRSKHKKVLPPNVVQKIESERAVLIDKLVNRMKKTREQKVILEDCKQNGMF